MIIDCNTIFGYWRYSDADYSIDRIKQILIRHRIDKALIISTKSIFYDDAAGNEETLRICRENQNYCPVGTIALSKYLDAEEEIAKRKGQGFKAFRLFNEYQGIDMEGILFSSLLKVLEKYEMPLIIRGTDFELKNYVDKIAYAVKDKAIPVIVLDASGGYNLSGVIEAAKYAQNLYFSTRLFTTPGSIELFCEEVSPARLLLGTGIPFYYGNQSIFRIQTADIDEKIKQDILANNLNRILGGV